MSGKIPPRIKSQGEPEKLGTLPFVIGGLSYIPLIGVPFGLIAVIWGLATGKRGGKTLSLVGAGGIALTVVLYGGLFYFGFVQRGGVYDELRTHMAQNNLNALVKVIEFHKVTHGEYPASLEVMVEAMPEESAGMDRIVAYDPRIFAGQDSSAFFYYEKVDAGHYYLRAVGPDGDPWSEGSFGPQVEAGQGALGLLPGPPATL